ncbi:MAG: mechanosensitive ion channel family protein [Pararobbsia sp.]
MFDVRVPFSADVDRVTHLIHEVGKELHDDIRYRRDMLGPVEVFGLDRFDPNWMVVKGQIKTRPLQQWPIIRAFNQRLKRGMDEEGIEIPVPQMMVRHPADAASAAAARHDEAGAPGARRARDEVWVPPAARRLFSAAAPVPAAACGRAARRRGGRAGRARAPPRRTEAGGLGQIRGETCRGSRGHPRGDPGVEPGAAADPDRQRQTRARLKGAA